MTINDFIELPGRYHLPDSAAKRYAAANTARRVWCHRERTYGYLVEATNDPDARACTHKTFTMDGAHLGWVKAEANGALVLFRKDGQTRVPTVAAIPAPQPIYGEQFVTYAAGPCPRCRGQHAGRTIREDNRVRFKLLRFAAELSATSGELADARDAFVTKQVNRLSFSPAPKHADAKEQRRLRDEREFAIKEKKKSTEANAMRALVQRTLPRDATDERKAWHSKAVNEWTAIETKHAPIHPLIKATVPADIGGTMLGMLICPKQGSEIIYVASSGGFWRTHPAFDNVARLHGLVVCDTPKSRTTLDRGKIPGDVYASCKAAGAQQPGTCAAPRMIAQAIEDEVDSDVSKWRMSEVWYWKSGMNPAAQDLAWVPGLTAYSCDTCMSLLPLFFCPDFHA